MSCMFIFVMSYSHFMSNHGHFKSHHGHLMCVMVTLSMIRSLLLFQVSCHMVTINVDMVTFSNIMDTILMLWLLRFHRTEIYTFLNLRERVGWVHSIIERYLL